MTQLDYITEADTTADPPPRGNHSSHLDDSPQSPAVSSPPASSITPSLEGSAPHASSRFFYDVLPSLLAARRMRLDVICPPHDPIARRALEEYGALFVADASLRVPDVCVFACEAAVADFQRQAGSATVPLDASVVELQPAALQALLAARDEAHDLGLTLTPRGGSEASRRSYADTSRLWLSRVLPALEHWCACGCLSVEEADAVRALPPAEQVAAVLEWEARGIFFSKDFKKSVMRSVALPGTSQHLAMLAFDVTEFRDARVRSVLARHGWFQTVLSDLPHFTFLGRAEADLPDYGLKRVVADEQAFYVPHV